MLYAIGIVVTACLLGWYLVNRSSDEFQRGRHIHQCNDVLRSLALSVKGSSVVLFHEGTDKFLQFRKGFDGRDNEIVFALPRAPWSVGLFEAVEDKLTDIGCDYSIELRPNVEGPPMDFLEVSFSGSLDEVSHNATVLARMLLEPLEIGTDDRFTFRYSGRRDTAAWRRAHEPAFRKVAQKSTSRLARWFAEQQLEVMEDDDRAD